MPPRPPDPDHVARAYELYLECGSGPQVLERIRAEGVKVSQTQLYEWIHSGQASAKVISLLEHAEEVVKSSNRLDIAMMIVIDGLRAGRADPVQAAKAIVAIEKVRIHLLGLAQPTRISLVDERERAKVDVSVAEAIRAAQNDNAEKERTLRGGGTAPGLPGPGGT